MPPRRPATPRSRRPPIAAADAARAASILDGEAQSSDRRHVLRPASLASGARPGEPRPASSVPLATHFRELRARGRLRSALVEGADGTLVYPDHKRRLRAPRTATPCGCLELA